MKLAICKVHVNYRTLFLDYWHTDYWRSLVLMIWCQLACAISNKGLWKCFSVCKLPVISIYFHDPWIETFILLPPPPKKWNHCAYLFFIKLSCLIYIYVKKNKEVHTWHKSCKLLYIFKFNFYFHVTLISLA